MMNLSKQQAKRRRVAKIKTAKSILLLGSSEIGQLSNGHGSVPLHVSTLWDWAIKVLRKAGKRKFVKKALAKNAERHRQLNAERQYRSPRTLVSPMPPRTHDELMRLLARSIGGGMPRSRDILDESVLEKPSDE